MCRVINYLEIGSCQGLSMAMISILIRDACSGNSVSIDPYFADGYRENDITVPVNKNSKLDAYRLYKMVGVQVRHIEDISSSALTEMIRGGERYDLVYVDGSHEGMNPMRDLALSLELITHGGIVMLDDYQTYTDVRVIKDLCDRSYVKVAESWKVAAYEVLRS